MRSGKVGGRGRRLYLKITQDEGAGRVRGERWEWLVMDERKRVS